MLAALAIVACALVTPALADTSSDLDQAKAKLDDARAELQRVAVAWNDAESRLAQAEDAVDRASGEIARLRGELADIQVRLNERAVVAFMAGGDLSVGSLLSASSLTEMADRWQFTISIIQGDDDLATEVGVRTVELGRQQERLTAAVQARTGAAADFDSQRASVSSSVDRYASLVSDLQDKLDQQSFPVSAPGGPVTGSGAVATCPVAGPNGFTDSFGDPRPGGRTHQGIDLIAPFGTPVVATHSGTVHQTSSSLGGFGVVVFHDGSSDWTFYTHFSSYGATGHVSAGTVIGYVGSTGDTNVNHLHFEYHPGGGSAVDPYRLLLAVC